SAFGRSQSFESKAERRSDFNKDDAVREREGKSRQPWLPVLFQIGSFSRPVRDPDLDPAPPLRSSAVVVVVASSFLSPAGTFPLDPHLFLDLVLSPEENAAKEEVSFRNPPVRWSVGGSGGDAPLSLSISLPYSPSPAAFPRLVTTFVYSSKFLCIKGIVFFCFWQGIVLEVLVGVGVIKSRHFWLDVEHIEEAIQNVLVCVEMVIFSVIQQYAYHAAPYSGDIVAKLKMGKAE
ncbi:hypothetical protein ACLOJK_004822, partial [Asimina triloba]